MIFASCDNANITLLRGDNESCEISFIKMLQCIFYINYAFSPLLSFLQLSIITCICYVYLVLNDVVFFTKT